MNEYLQKHLNDSLNLVDEALNEANLRINANLSSSTTDLLKRMSLAIVELVMEVKAQDRARNELFNEVRLAREAADEAMNNLRNHPPGGQ